MNNYDRIARVIRYLDAHHSEQPNLATLAAEAGLSPFHFHRLFSTWSGVTPKDFLQCLTLTSLKKLLRDGESVLDAALQTGMSGPGRAHDLCVCLEAASPGEIKSGGAGWTITAGLAESPFGDCLIAEGPRGVCHLAFAGAGEQKNAWRELKMEWPNAQLREDNITAQKKARQIFSGSPTSERAPLRVFVQGTEFQVRVWRALLRVGPGQLTTYGRLAQKIGHPSAARAVGSAVGANPIAFLIPCHRVIRESGVIGEYRWSPLRKRALLTWETLRTSSVSAASETRMPSRHERRPMAF